MTQVSADEAGRKLPELIAAAVRAEEVVLVEGDRPVSRLVPVEADRPRPRFGSARGMLEMSDDDDFDAPLKDFAESME